MNTETKKEVKLEDYSKDRYLRMFLDKYFAVRKEAIEFRNVFVK